MDTAADQPTPETDPARPLAERERGRIKWEIWLVLGVSLGMSALYAVTDLVQALTRPTPLSSQVAALNTSQSTRHVFDLIFQLLGITSNLVPALLAVYLLARDGREGRLGLDTRHLRRDGILGAGLALLIGIPGLGLYVAAHALGISLTVVAESLPDVWWRYPVLVLSAVQNAALEEIVVVGYLLTRLSDLGVKRRNALLASAVLRGSYHLYQGFGAFFGNAVMGLIFGYFFTRTRRVVPLIVAHALIDTVSFVGYALLAGRVSWLH